MNLRRMDFVHINGEGELVERPRGLLVDWASYEALEAELAAALQSRNDECRLRQAAEAYAARLAVERGTLERECHREHDKNVGYMDRIAALEADRDRISLSLDLARADRDKWFNRARALETALREDRADFDAINAMESVYRIDKVLGTAPETPVKSQRCAALVSTDPPQDCDAPFCGCNPAWPQCIEWLQEAGWKAP